MPTTPISRIDVSAENDITVVAGMSRSGKSAFVKQEIRGRRAVLAWDPEGEYVAAGITRAVHTRAALLELASSPAAGRWSYVAPITRAEFNYWALACLHKANHCKPLTVVAEETADVTHSGKAPMHWGQLVRKGGKRGVSLFAITQTPPESDKTVMRNARRIVCFIQDRDPDIAYMAREMRVPLERIAALKKLEAIIVDKHAPPERRVQMFAHRFARRSAAP